MNQPHRRRKRRSNPLVPIASFLGVILLVLCVLAVVLQVLPDPQNPTTGPTGADSTSSSTTQPTDPTTKPTDPTTKPTDPTTRPTDPTTQPTDPTTRPTDPTTRPTDPTQPSDPVDLEAFFAESVFIGDSVTLKLRNYCVTRPNALYGAKILSAGSYAVRHAIVDPDPNNKDIVSITYQGVGMRPEDALAQIGAKRVFIMLGMNDIAFGVDYTLGNWKILIDNIREKNPDIEIYIQSGTPIHANKDRNDSDGKGLSNGNMDIYNQKLEVFCQENGCYFVNLAPHFKDENGDLANQYCSDPNAQGCHFTDAGVELWIQLLKDYASNR